MFSFPVYARAPPSFQGVRETRENAIESKGVCNFKLPHVRLLMDPLGLMDTLEITVNRRAETSARSSGHKELPLRIWRLIKRR